MLCRIEKCAIVLLAAGQSSRLGRPKQLLEIKGKKLITRAAEAAMATGSRPVVAVLGAYADEIQPWLNLPGIDVVLNEGWQEGMASSIRTGINRLAGAYPDVDGAILMVCDQPYLDESVLLQLLELQSDTGFKAAACVYGGKLGTPALFHQSLFEALMQLEGDKGARGLLEQLGSEVAKFAFPWGVVDIDEEDFAQTFADKIHRRDTDI